MRLEPSSVQTGAKIIAVESCGDGFVLIGTDKGEVAIVRGAESVVHTKNDAKVLSILAIDSHNVLVFSERANGSIGSATAYTVPGLEAVVGLTLHDVCGGVALGKRVAVFSSGAIRILRFTPETTQKASVERSIELKGVVKGCRCETDYSIMLVATPTEYQLVNVKTAAKIPLFPIHSSLEPLMSAFGSDFVVVQGTGELEPSMGLIVNAHGEVARSGVVIQWDSYPKNLVTTGDYIFAIARHNSSLVVHHVDPDNNSVREVDVGIPHTAHGVFRLSFPIYTLDNELLERLGNEAIARAKMEIAIVLEDGVIQLWKAPTRMGDLEKKIINGDVNEVVPDPSTAGSEQGVAELEYLSLLLVLHSLNEGNYEKATKAWLEGTQISFKIVLYIYGDETASEPEIYPGLRSLLQTLRQKGEQGHLNKSFLRAFLRTEIKRHRRNPSTAYTTAKLLELRYAKLLDEAELTRFLLERDMKAREEVLAWLEDTKAYGALKHYYTFSNRQVPLAKLRLRIARDDNSSSADVQQAAQGLVDYALTLPSGSLDDGLNIWDLTMELVSNPRIESKLSLELLTNPKFESTFEPAEILKTLKERTESGEAWRSYLKHLVYTRGIFTDDLATILIADIIGLMNTTSGNVRTSDAVAKSYDKFRSLPWPKPLYRKFLIRWARNSSNGYPSELMDLQEELWHLLDQQSTTEVSNQLELPSIMSTFESRLPSMHVERATIFRNLGLHEQSIELLCKEITDYRAVLDYESAVVNDDNDDTRRDITWLAFKQVLTSNTRDRNVVLHDFMNERGEWLEIGSVLSQLSEDTPFSIVADYAIRNVKYRQALEQQAKMVHALTKADALRYQSWSK